MKVLALWYGGSNYAAPDGHNPKDCEHFDSIKDAKRSFANRADFNPYYPCVDAETCEMHLYFGPYHEDGPDRVLTLGKRGGVRVSK